MHAHHANSAVNTASTLIQHDLLNLISSCSFKFQGMHQPRIMSAVKSLNATGRRGKAVAFYTPCMVLHVQTERAHAYGAHHIIIS